MLDLAEQTQNRKVGNYQMQFVGANCGNLTDEHDALYLIYHGKSAINLSGTNDPDLDKLLVAQRQETNPEQRREIQRQAVRIIAEKAYTISWVYPPKWEFWPSALKGHAPNSMVPYPGFGNAWFDR
jgi:ABC-type transport system substrate-binding protein